MIRVGDRVHPIFDMRKEGDVVFIESAKNKTWMVGGAMTKTRWALIRLPDGTEHKYKVDDLMRVE